jgi:hypothetical protein
MKTIRTSNIHLSVLTVIVAVLSLGGASPSIAQDYGPGQHVELSVMGGIQALNENDTALPDHVLSIPAVATLTYHLTSYLAAEGEFTWMIPVEQSVELASGESEDLKTPDVLAYQANLRASLPLARSSWAPYVAGGAGAVTFLSNTDEDRLPQLEDSETAFAVNFGAGVAHGITDSWALRADFREFVAFPADDAAGLSTDGSADEIWMERATLGLAYRF